ncbi:DMT family transporter [Altererythrobacter lutimaris]|uniref:DMT family transporter n=1 Tax=Altererythrobacter lutimaris TaxID=2743979 RepID=A0A850HCD5_9SPHN|nr:DMT family transporter [Altererythrobacter lutimaris]NVE94586.1 DMT family transporter [Altererythrobacter lutimaris]
MQDTERSGLLLALAGFALLSVGDGVIKSMAGVWPALPVAALRFVIGAIGLAIFLSQTEGIAALKPAQPWLQIGRGVCVSVASVCFFSAVYIMPLAETMAIAFLAPVFTALLSGPILGERVRAPVWIASGMAMIGVVVILRPNLLELGLPAMFPLVSAFFFGLMIVLNRKAAGRGSPLAMQFYMAGVAATVLTALAVMAKFSGVEMLDFGPPSWDVVLRCAIVACTATGAHWMVYLGTTRAGASQVAPCTYIQMLVATLIGWLWFGDVPDALTLLGAAIIIGAGLYLWGASKDRGSMTKDVSQDR